MPTTQPRLRRAIYRTVLRIAVLVVLIVGFHAGMGWLMIRIGSLHAMTAQPGIVSLMILALVGYALLIAIPFMPGIEVGVALLMLQGAKIAPFVYLATMTGLMLAYLVGSRVPLRILHNAFRDLHLRRACQLIADIDRIPAADRLNRLQTRLPRPLAALAVNYRYLMLGVLINIPGTFAIGGGGGILMLAGIVRLFQWPAILLTVAFATLPVPLVVIVFGAQSVQDLFG